MPSRLLASLAFVALMGLAVSCGEEQPSGGGQESPDREAQSAQEAPAAPPAEETTARPEETAPEPERTTAEAEAREEAAPEPAEDEAVAEEATTEGASEQYDEDQYSEDQQYDEDQYEGSETGEVAAAPADPTMYLSVPKLGISGALVIDGEAGLEAGTMHLPGTGYPWISGSNTYIAGHRVGFAGTGSDHIFYNLPAMAPGDEVTLEDANGTVYSFRVSEVFAVTPFDTWVIAPTGTDTVTLQACTETPDDWWTIGPRLMSSGPESGRLIVRATKVA